MSRRWIRFTLRSFVLVIVLICLVFGLRASTIQRQQRALAHLKKLGAQLQLSEGSSSAAWLLGATSDVREVHFLGPRVGNENLKDIVHAASQLRGLNRMTFTETRISRRGEHQLRSRLEDVEVEVFTPVLAPPHSLPRR
jgi:hypothetical protein